MKRSFVLVLVFLFTFIVFPAAADMVWTPMDDYFMETWDPESDQTCDYQARPYYLAAGEKGYVTAVKTPLDPTPLKTYPNGTYFKITFVCGKGEDRWGTIEAVRLPNEIAFTEDWKGESGYIAFGDLVRAYDTEAFIEANGPEIHAFAEDGYDMCKGDEFVLWLAPNSGVQMQYVTKDYISYLCLDHCVDCDPSDRIYSYGAFYIDPEGKRWVDVTLRRETERGWFCLDDLTGGGVKPANP